MPVMLMRADEIPISDGLLPFTNETNGYSGVT